VACECVDGSCVPTVENGVVKGSFDKALVFGETAEFECKEGYTTTGHAEGVTTFKVSCTADVVLTEPGSCLPVECGEVPEIANSVPSESKVLVYQDVATVACSEGYTTTGKAKGVNSFDFKCLASGKFEGSGSCIKVSCEVPEKIKYAEMSMRELFSWMR